MNQVSSQVPTHPRTAQGEQPLRLLVVSPFPPHAGAAHGGAVYLATFLGGLAAKHEVHVLALDPNPETAVEVPYACHRVKHLRKADQPAGQRHLGTLRNLTSWRAGRPLLATKQRSKKFRRLLLRMAVELQPDLILVEFASMAQYLEDLRRAANGAGCPLVFTDHERAVSGAIGPGSWFSRRDHRLWQRYARRYFCQADLVQALNADDAAALSENLDRPVLVRPALVTLPNQAVAPAESPRRLLFLGNYLHHPNPQAALHLVRHVWPRVRAAVPDAELWLAGPHATAAVQAAGGEPGVQVTGFAPDLAELFGQVRALVAPVYSGSGVRIKTLTALAHGLPVVANKLGLQGIDVTTHACRTAEQDTELARHCIELLEQPAAAAAAGRAGREWAAESLSTRAVVDQQVARFRELL